MKINNSTRRTALQLCRIASFFAVLVSMSACGAIQALEGKNNNGSSNSGNNSSSQNSSDTQTNAQSLASSAAEANNQATQAYVQQCQKNPACKDDADQVSKLIGEAVQEIEAQQDASATLKSFDQALTTLIQCMEQHPPTDGSKPTPPQPAQDSNKTCSKSQDANGVTVTTCTSTTEHCTSRQLPNGDVEETCVCGNGNHNPGGTSGNPNNMGNPNATSTTGGTTTSGNPNSTGNPNITSTTGGTTTAGSSTGATTGAGGTGTGGSTGGTVLNPNSPAGTGGGSTTGGTSAGSSEKCVAQALPDGSMSVTCTCNVQIGTCTVETQTP